MDLVRLPSPLAFCKPSAESIKTFKLSIHGSDDSTSGTRFVVLLSPAIANGDLRLGISRHSTSLHHAVAPIVGTFSTHSSILMRDIHPVQDQ